MTAMEISQSLKLHALKQQSWQIQACSAVTGEAAPADKWHRGSMTLTPTPPHPHPTPPALGRRAVPGPWRRRPNRRRPCATPSRLLPSSSSLAALAPRPLSRLPAPVNTACATQVSGCTRGWTGWLTPFAPSDDVNTYLESVYFSHLSTMLYLIQISTIFHFILDDVTDHVDASTRNTRARPRAETARELSRPESQES